VSFYFDSWRLFL